MDDRRKTDSKAYTRLRSDRILKSGGKWYFSTREGTIEGPFEIRREAEYRLENYIKVMVSGLLPLDCNLAIQPLDLHHSQ